VEWTINGKNNTEKTLLMVLPWQLCTSPKKEILMDDWTWEGQVNLALTRLTLSKYKSM